MPKRKSSSPAAAVPSNKEQHHQGDDSSNNEKNHPPAVVSNKKMKQNPFSILGAPHHNNNDKNETEQQQQQQLLEHVLVFSDAAQQKRGKGDTRVIFKLTDSIQFLIDFIEQQSSGTAATATDSSHGNEQIISASDISQLLLPWAVQQVLHVRASSSSTASAAPEEDEQVLVWKALRVTLSYLLCKDSSSSGEDKSKATKNITTTTANSPSLVLSQSDLFKLVPRIAQMASTTTTTESSSSSSIHDQDNNAASSDVYKLLLKAKLFTPTMDVACKSVFCPIVSNLNLDRQPLFSILHATRTTNNEMEITTSKTNVDNDCSILMTTLEWMQSILKSGRGNPKTTFQLIATRTVLLAFSRAYYFLHLHDIHQQQQQQHLSSSSSSCSILWMSEIPLFENNNVVQVGGEESNTSQPPHHHAAELVRTILYDALFHASSHMDGFRSILLSKRKTNKKKKLKGSISDGGCDATNNTNDAAAEANNTAKPSSTKSSFSCYQQDLLDFINDTLNVKNDDHQGGGIQHNDDDATTTSRKEGAFIIPILYRGFLIESAKWHEQNRTNGGGGGGGGLNTGAGNSGGGGKRPFIQQDTAIPLTAMQFAMFVEMATPLRELALFQTNSQGDNGGTAALSLVALRALREMTNLLLIHDAYIPAEDDAQRSQTAFLDEIATQLLDRAATAIVDIKVDSNNDSRGDGGGAGVEWLSECIHLLRTLVQLNHLLLHERLVQVMTIAFQSNNTRLQPQIADFFAIFVDTYRKLRQQSHFFQSVLVALTQFEQEQKHVQISVLGRLLNESQTLTSSIALLVQDIPITQVREIFESIEQWIVERSKLVVKSTSDALDVVVQLTILTARNVRVDSSRVKEVAAIVKKFVETAVTVLMEQDEDGHQFDPKRRHGSVRAALSLCGWFIHLQSRCAFWLGRGAQLLIPTKVQDYMTKTVSELTAHRGLSSADSVYDDVLFLASHRLEQLSSLIHDEQVAELLRGSPSTRGSDFVLEARQLAAFMAQVAKSRKVISRPSSRPRWVVIAATLHSWAPFAEEQHIDWFLDWLFSVLALDPSSPCVPPDSLAYRDDLRGIDVEVEVANGLMLDASFHEISQIAPRLRIAALCCSSKWMSWALANHKSMKKALSLMADIRQYSKTKSDIIVDIEIPHCKLESVEVIVMKRKLSRALRPILLVNGLSQPLSKSEGQALSRVALVLDQVCVALSKLDSEIRNATVTLTIALRALLARCLDDLSQDEFAVMSTTDPHCIKVFKHIVSSYKHLYFHDDGTSLDQQNIQHQLLVVTGKLVGNITSRSMSSRDAVADLMRTLQPFSEKGDEGNDSNSSPTIRVTLIRYTLLGLEMGLGVMADDCPGGTFETVWKLGWKTYSLFHEQLYEDRYGRGQCFRLVGDLLRLAVKWQISHDSNQLEKVTHGVIRQLSSHVTSSTKGDDGSDKNSMEAQQPDNVALYYAVACIANTKPSAEVSLSVLQEIIQVGQPHDLLDSSFCHLVSELDGKHLEVILRRLLLLRDDEQNDGNEETCTRSSLSLANRLRFLDFIVLYSKKDSHAQCISQFGQDVFLLSLQALYKRHFGQSTSTSTVCCHWTEGIVQGTKLLTNLIKRRDLISLRERDLALTLAHLSAVLGPGVGRKDAMTTAVYLACIRLFSFLQQRFPKQLHTCAPSVISLMHSFLRHAMMVNVIEVTTITSQQQRLLDQDIAIRAQEFSRICELLISHREVYKKHIVSLVLHFVQCASATGDTRSSNDGPMPLAVRESLVPAIHYLLDTFSVYETKTLNAHMDLRCKLTFRSIYQSYQKVHTYKGQ